MTCVFSDLYDVDQLDDARDVLDEEDTSIFQIHIRGQETRQAGNLGWGRNQRLMSIGLG